MRYIYTFLFYLILPFVFLKLLWKSRKNPGYRTNLKERLGYTSLHFDKSIWVHAVSLGETIAAIPLVKELKKRYPHLPIVVTNMTPTGKDRVNVALKGVAVQTYIPYDVPTALNRFLKKTNPIIAIIMETELWPNLIAACKNKNIPIVITNARLSEKSANGYMRIASLTQHMLNSIDLLAVQNSQDAERFVNLGIGTDKVRVTGNLKFDLEIPLDLHAKSEVLRHELGQRFIWIAASTHPTEEEIVLKAHEQILKDIPNALLILVPRHPERFDEVANLCQKFGMKVARRSKNETCSEDTAVYLGDTMGEMLLMYSVANVAFVAGSFAPIGGHNMLEPAVLGKPILTGPHLHNFAEISKTLITEQAMACVTNADELAAHILKLYHDKELAKNMGAHAFKVVADNRGALNQQLSLITQVLSSHIN